MGTEDERIAATIYASLSSYIITASLGVIAAQAALATFVLDKREHLFWFHLWMILGICASVLSIVRGGKGIGKLASEGFKGAWKLDLDADYFNQQAGLCLVGMAFLLVSLFCGTTKAENPKATEQIQELTHKVEEVQSDLSNLEGKYAALLEQVKSSQSQTKAVNRKPKNNGKS